MTPKAHFPLEGQTVLLLGGGLNESHDHPIEDKDFEVVSKDEEDVRVEEAVIALTRAVLIRGGRLAFQNDPVVTPLVIEVGMEYWQSLPGEKQEGDRQERGTRGLPLLIIDAESARKDHESLEFAIRIGCAKLLPEEMMKEVPVSLAVCIGGSETVRGILTRLSAFWDRPVAVYAIPSTGGAARNLATQGGVTDAEGQIANTIVGKRRELHFLPPEGEGPNRESRESSPFGERSILEQEHIPEFRYALYPLVMSVILDSEREATPRTQVRRQ
jgi:hypothetical protein